MQLTAVVFGEYEGSFIGVQLSNVYLEVDHYSFLVGLVMLVLSFWFWLLLGLYMDAVLPKEYGDRLPACFCCMRKYWCRNREDEHKFDD